MGRLKGETEVAHIFRLLVCLQSGWIRETKIWPLFCLKIVYSCRMGAISVVPRGTRVQSTVALWGRSRLVFLFPTESLTLFLRVFLFFSLSHRLPRRKKGDEGGDPWKFPSAPRSEFGFKLFIFTSGKLKDESTLNVELRGRAIRFKRPSRPLSNCQVKNNEQSPRLFFFLMVKTFRQLQLVHVNPRGNKTSWGCVSRL